MVAQKQRSNSGQSRFEISCIMALAAVVYYGYQHFAIYQAPNQLVNKDFVCGDQALGRRMYTSCVYGSQNPRALVEWVRASSTQARLSAPETALRNEQIRNSVQGQLTNLNYSSWNASLNDDYNPLVVHVLEVEDGNKDVPLLVVRPMNKKHKGETWYIAAKSINPVANVTGFAEAAAKIHRPGLSDIPGYKRRPGVIGSQNIFQTFDSIQH